MAIGLTVRLKPLFRMVVEPALKIISEISPTRSQQGKGLSHRIVFRVGCFVPGLDSGFATNLKSLTHVV